MLRRNLAGLDVVDRQRRSTNLRIVDAHQRHADAFEFRQTRRAHAHAQQHQTFARAFSDDAIEHAVLMIAVLDVVEHQVDISGSQRSGEWCRHRIVEARRKERHQRRDAWTVDAADCQTPRRAIGAEIQFLHRQLHRRAGGVSDTIAAVEHAADGGDADTGAFGDVINGRRERHLEALS